MNNIHVRIITPPDSITDAELVRTKVFQEEQGIGKELDFDGKDQVSTHVVVYKDQAPIGTGRIRKIDENSVKIERVAVVSEMRGQGIGKRIMLEIDRHLSKTKISKIILDAQLHAMKFYESLGYTQEGEVFEEVGIPHVVMIKYLK